MGAAEINHEQNHIGTIVDYRSDRPRATSRDTGYYAIELALPLFTILFRLHGHSLGMPHLSWSYYFNFCRVRMKGTVGGIVQDLDS